MPVETQSTNTTGLTPALTLSPLFPLPQALTACDAHLDKGLLLTTVFYSGVPGRPAEASWHQDSRAFAGMAVHATLSSATLPLPLLPLVAGTCVELVVCLLTSPSGLHVYVLDPYMCLLLLIVFFITCLFIAPWLGLEQHCCVSPMAVCLQSLAVLFYSCNEKILFCIVLLIQGLSSFFFAKASKQRVRLS